MHFAADIDGTLDLDPSSMASLLNALRSAGHRVSVLTGASTPHPTQRDADEKENYLRSLGMAHAWDTLVVFPDPPHKAKARWIRKHSVDLYIDNDTTNAEYASRYCTVLLPWNSVIPSKLHDKVEEKE